MKTLIEVGFIERAHGLHGELMLRLHNPGSSVLEEVPRLVLTRGEQSREFKIAGKRGAGKAHILRLDGVASRDDADAWKGAQAYALRQDLPPLEDGEYFLSDLVGARVQAPDGEVGVVVRIQMHPSVDSVIIQTPEGVEVELPLVEPWLESVDAEQGVVVLSSRDGLIDP